eukprot:m51a1_g12321 putative rho gtpase-activating protein 27 (832) ;mRNA; r:421169-424304
MRRGECNYEPPAPTAKQAPAAEQPQGALRREESPRQFFASAATSAGGAGRAGRGPRPATPTRPPGGHGSTTDLCAVHAQGLLRGALVYAARDWRRPPLSDALAPIDAAAGAVRAHCAALERVEEEGRERGLPEVSTAAHGVAEVEGRLLAALELGAEKRAVPFRWRTAAAFIAWSEEAVARYRALARARASLEAHVPDYAQHLLDMAQRLHGLENLLPPRSRDRLRAEEAELGFAATVVANTVESICSITSAALWEARAELFCSSEQSDSPDMRRRSWHVRSETGSDSPALPMSPGTLSQPGSPSVGPCVAPFTEPLASITPPVYDSPGGTDSRPLSLPPGALEPPEPAEPPTPPPGARVSRMVVHDAPDSLSRAVSMPAIDIPPPPYPPPSAAGAGEAALGAAGGPPRSPGHHRRKSGSGDRKKQCRAEEAAAHRRFPSDAQTAIPTVVAAVSRKEASRLLQLRTLRERSSSDCALSALMEKKSSSTSDMHTLMRHGTMKSFRRHTKVSSLRPVYKDVVAGKLTSTFKIYENPKRSLMMSGPVHALFGSDGAMQRPLQLNQTSLYLHYLFSDCWVISSGSQKKVAVYDLRDTTITFTENQEKGFDVGQQKSLCVVANAPVDLLAAIRTATIKARVFAVPLEILVESEEDPSGIPGVVRQCTQYITERGGREREGIFRLSGSLSKVVALQTALNKRMEIDPAEYGPHEVAQVLKRFLSELPEPAFTHEGWRRLTSGSTVRKSVRDVVETLPPTYKRLVTFLFQFFYSVLEFSATNKMSAQNLAIVIAPCVLRPRTETMTSFHVTPKEQLYLITKSKDIVQLMLQDYAAIFT